MGCGLIGSGLRGKLGCENSPLNGARPGIVIALVRALQLVCYVSACFGRGWLQAAGVGDMWRVRKGEGALYIYICKSLIRRCFFLVAEKSSESSADDCHFVVALCPACSSADEPSWDAKGRWSKMEVAAGPQTVIPWLLHWLGLRG